MVSLMRKNVRTLKQFRKQDEILSQDIARIVYWKIFFHQTYKLLQIVSYVFISHSSMI